MYLFDSQSVRIGDITTSFPLHLVIPDITGLRNSTDIGLGNIIARYSSVHGSNIVFDGARGSRGD